MRILPFNRYLREVERRRIRFRKISTRIFYVILIILIFENNFDYILELIRNKKCDGCLHKKVE